MITASGIKCETTTEIDKYLWAKMLYNCALNPLGVILNCTYGKLTENEYSKNIMNSIIDEIFAVIKKVNTPHYGIHRMNIKNYSTQN